MPYTDEDMAKLAFYPPLIPKKIPDKPPQSRDPRILSVVAGHYPLKLDEIAIFADGKKFWDIKFS